MMNFEKEQALLNQKLDTSLLGVSKLAQPAKSVEPVPDKPVDGKPSTSLNKLKDAIRSAAERAQVNDKLTIPEMRKMIINNVFTAIPAEELRQASNLLFESNPMLELIIPVSSSNHYTMFVRVKQDNKTIYLYFKAVGDNDSLQTDFGTITLQPSGRKTIHAHMEDHKGSDPLYVMNRYQQMVKMSQILAASDVFAEKLVAYLEKI